MKDKKYICKNSSYYDFQWKEKDSDSHAFPNICIASLQIVKEKMVQDWKNVQTVIFYEDNEEQRFSLQFLSIVNMLHTLSLFIVFLLQHYRVTQTRLLYSFWSISEFFFV